jgi:hypothetical protein
MLLGIAPRDVLCRWLGPPSVSSGGTPEAGVPSGTGLTSVLATHMKERGSQTFIDEPPMDTSTVPWRAGDTKCTGPSWPGPTVRRRAPVCMSHTCDTSEKHEPS